MSDAATEVKARLDIVDVIGGYVRLQRSGRSFKALCPFHSEKSPSFTVNPDRQSWHCFGCSEGGDVITFVEKIEHLDFLETLQRLADRAGVDIELHGKRQSVPKERRTRLYDLYERAQKFYEHVLWNTDTGADGRELLEQRGIDEKIARTFGVGFAPAGGMQGDALARYLKNRLNADVAELDDAHLCYRSGGNASRDRFRHRFIFPIRDSGGRTIAFGARACGDAKPKYLNSPNSVLYDKSKALFGIDLAHKAIADEKAVVIVEGYFDVVAVHSVGVHNVVASSGTALTADQVRTLGRTASTFILCFDADTAGQAATTRAVDAIAADEHEARICQFPEDIKDADELSRRDPAELAAMIAGAEREWQVLLDRSIGDAEGGSTEAKREALPHVITTLIRIPQATTRQLYVDQAARRLEVDPATLRSDVDLIRAKGQPARPLVVAAYHQPATNEGLPQPPAGHDIPAWEEYLLALTLQAPEIVHRVAAVNDLKIEELSSEVSRTIYAKAAELPLQLHTFGESERNVAARLLARQLPELAGLDAEDVCERAAADCIARIRQSKLHGEISGTRKALAVAKDAGNNDESSKLALQLYRLAVQDTQLRQPVKERKS